MHSLRLKYLQVKPLLVLISALLLSIGSPFAAAEIYKWTDERGIVHYGDERPESTNSKAPTVETIVLDPPSIEGTATQEDRSTQNTTAPTTSPTTAAPATTDSAQSIANSPQFIEWSTRLGSIVNDIITQINIWRGATPVITNETILEQTDNNSPSDSRTIASRNHVEIFTTAWCAVCKKAKNWLTKNNIPFTEYDVEKDQMAFRRMQNLGGGNSVPFALINGKAVKGFSPKRYQDALRP